MTFELLWMSVLVFVPVAVVAFVALRNIWQPATLPAEKSVPSVLKPPTSSDLLFGFLTYPCALMVPSTGKHRMALYQELRTAAFYRPNALTDFLALRRVLTLLPLLFAGFLALVVEPLEIPVVAIGGVTAAVLGFSLPRLYVQVRGRNRTQRIERGLPTGVDLLVLALTAGLNLLTALKRTANELRFSFAALAEEIDVTCRQAELLSLEHALEQLADRVRIADVRNLALILAQSQRQGTDATAVLLETSNNLRTSIRQRAEAQANRAGFWMTFPTVGCFLVACGLIVIGPVFLEFRRRSHDANQVLQAGQKQISKNAAAAGSRTAQAASVKN